MSDANAKIERFINACNELISGKFILADTKISELLKSVAASKQLTELFTAVTERFDFTSAKRDYLRFPAEQGAAHGVVYLPQERGDILAFVFCLLVEFDNGTMKFNDFLLRYFYEDGSYTASYALFTDRMLRPFRDIVAACFPNAGKAQVTQQRAVSEGVFEEFAEKTREEYARICAYDMFDEDKGAGMMILSELLAAIGRSDTSEMKALLCGYNYFLRVTASRAPSSEALFALIEKL